MSFPRISGLGILLLIASHASISVGAPGKMGQVEFRAFDKGTGQPIAARMHVKDAAGKPVKPPKAPFWRDHFVFDGTIVLELPPGNYTFELECGPEYKVVTGNVTIEKESADTKSLEAVPSAFFNLCHQSRFIPSGGYGLTS